MNQIDGPGALARFNFESDARRMTLIGLIGDFLLLIQPIDDYANQNLTFHMFQHIGLFIFAVVFGYGLERLFIIRLPALRQRIFPVWKAFTSIMIFNSRTKGLILAAVVPGIVWGFWHYPPNFDLASTTLIPHLLEHLSYIVSGSMVGLSIVAIPRRWKIGLLYFAFMQAGMMGSMMLVWPSFFDVYSAAQNTTMDTAMMMLGALGILGLSSTMLKQLDIV